MNSENEIIYFWKVSEPLYGCFSNFYPCTFVDPSSNLSYTYSEQYFMKKKQEIFDPDNHKLAEDIMNSERAIDIKGLGRKVANFDADIWTEKCYGIMVEALTLKFAQNEELAKILLSTSNKMIVEAAPNDKIWGIGISEEKARNGTPWNGSNLLGKALMEVRDELLKIAN